MSADLLRAWATIISASIWPLIVIVILITQRECLRNFLCSLVRIRLGNLEFEVDAEIRRQAQIVQMSKPREKEFPTKSQKDAMNYLSVVFRDFTMTRVSEVLSNYVGEFQRIAVSFDLSNHVREKNLDEIFSILRMFSFAAFQDVDERSGDRLNEGRVVDRLIQSQTTGGTIAAILFLQMQVENEKEFSKYMNFLGQYAGDPNQHISKQARIALSNFASRSRNENRDNQDVF